MRQVSLIALALDLHQQLKPICVACVHEGFDNLPVQHCFELTVASKCQSGTAWCATSGVAESIVDNSISILYSHTIWANLLTVIEDSITLIAALHTLNNLSNCTLCLAWLCIASQMNKLLCSSGISQKPLSNWQNEVASYNTTYLT